MKANHTSQKYRLENNIAKHYPQQITILKERINRHGGVFIIIIFLFM